MAHKRTTTLLVLLAVVALYSIVSLNMDDGALEYNTIFDHPPSLQPRPHAENSVLPTKYQQNIATPQQTKQANLPSVQRTAITDNLPFEFIVVGISYDNNDRQNSVALLRVPEGLVELNENDFLLNTSIMLVNIEANSVEFEFEETLFSLELTPPNLLASDYKKAEKSYAEYLQMSAKEIGSRPRIIEHIVTLTPTPYIADGKLASIGVNPALFKQAGLQEDDVVKTINGKSVTLESEFAELKKEIPQANTLTFLVMRKGRLITLYLDIPSEGLKINP